MTLDQLNTRPTSHPAAPKEKVRVGLVTTYPPTRCGIGRFSQSFVNAITETAGDQLEVEVIRLVEDRPEPVPGSQPVMEIVPDLPIGVRAAARRLNRCDVVVFQHEYGIYGPRDGEAILEMVRLVDRPKVAVLHTVLEDPSQRQREILEKLAEHCHLVTLSESARQRLIGRYNVSSSNVSMIPHGAGWGPLPPNPAPRRKIITWGLLGPGKGLERAIEAMTQVRDLTPPPVYQIVGRTHPGVVRTQGFAYRRSLEQLVKDLDLVDLVEFVDRYLDDDALYQLVVAADVVVVPYDNREQITSGVLTDAIAAGRPVVATQFPHALELLDNGAGVSVRHDSAALGQAMRDLLVDDEAYERRAAAAAARSSTLTWSACAERYYSLIKQLTSAAVAEPIDA